MDFEFLMARARLDETFQGLATLVTGREWEGVHDIAVIGVMCENVWRQS
jgi:hypothetical protein